MSDQLHFDTRQVNAGYDPKKHNLAVSTPIYATAGFDFPSAQYADDLFRKRQTGFLYTRVGNPTTAVLEERVKQLDGAVGAVAVASGMAAVSFALLSLAENGGHILASPYLYGATVDSFKQIYPGFGIRVDTAKHLREPERLAEEITPDTRAIFVESISNPNIHLLDIDAIAEVAHAHGVALVVDNSVATPFLYRPFEHGADIVVYSATKGLNGHGNVIAGLILESGKFDYHNPRYAHFDKKTYDLRDNHDRYRSFLDVFPAFPFTARIRSKYLAYMGATLSPFDAYLTLIGLETLSERLTKQSQNALALAEYLEQHPAVESVFYPGLKSSLEHRQAQEQFQKGVGGLLSFRFKGTAEQQERFINALRVIHYHVNIGDVRTLISDTLRTTHHELSPEDARIAEISANQMRISAGLEDIDDLKGDLQQAFALAMNG